MCEGCGCSHPEKLQSKPGECSPEQVYECHGTRQDEETEPVK